VPQLARIGFSLNGRSEIVAERADDVPVEMHLDITEKNRRRCLTAKELANEGHDLHSVFVG
jgi:hypothetical protein